MHNSPNPQVDKYLIDGCMRCQSGGTPKCKVLKWTAELDFLRQLVLECGLEEEVKWGVPVYIINGKNVITVNALKNSANIGFFKGVLLSDTHRLLEQQGSKQSDRLIKFSGLSQIEPIAEVLKEYVREAMQIEQSGQKVTFAKKIEPFPEELLQAFAGDTFFEQAFKSLTAGRQRGYVIHFSQPKQSNSRIKRIEKYKNLILEGKGMNDV